MSVVCLVQAIFIYKDSKNIEKARRTATYHELLDYGAYNIYVFLL